MTTKELIQTELDTFSEDNLKELYVLIQKFAKTKHAHQSFMEKLQQIHIDAPADFSVNFLNSQSNKGIEGNKLLEFAGCVGLDDLTKMSQVIEDNCARVNLNDW
ncbi:MAG: hypothetical protein QM487_08810 [Candidatus Marithrix sp.]